MSDIIDRFNRTVAEHELCKAMLTGSDPTVRDMILDELRHTYNAVNLRCELGRWIDPPSWLRRLQNQ